MSDDRVGRVSSTACPGCGLVLPESHGDGHPYIGASAACWELYGEVLAREYTDPAYFRMHRLTVDAYAAQHPGTDGRRQRQSVGVHLIGLHLQLGRAYEDTRALPAVRQRLVEAAEGWPWLEPPPRGSWRMTVFDVAVADDAKAHARLVREWAQAVWDGWREHHELVRQWTAGAMAG